MLKRILLPVIAVLVLAFTGASATAQDKLQWKLKVGEKFYLEEKSVSKSKAEVMGNAIEQSQTLTKITEVVVKSRTRDAVVLELKIESVDNKMELMGETIDAGEEISKLFKDLVFTLTLTNDGKMSKFEGYDRFTKNLDDGIANADEAKKIELKMVKSMLTEEAFKTGAGALFELLPSAAVKVGERWKREQSLSMGPMGNFKLALDLAYKGPGEGDTEKIAVTGTLSHEPGKGDAGDLPFKISKLDLNQNKIDGKLIFDKKANRLTLVEMHLRMGGAMTIEVMGNELTFDFEGTETRTTRLLEKRPVKD